MVKAVELVLRILWYQAWNYYQVIDTSERSSQRRCSVTKGFLRNFANFTGKHLCQSLFFNKIACNFIKKETLAQVFSCECSEISKTTFFIEHPRTTASEAKLSEA